MNAEITMEELDKKVDECWNYLIWKLAEMNKDSNEFTKARKYYGRKSQMFVTNGIKNRIIIPEIEPIPKGYYEGRNDYKKVRCVELDMAFNSVSDAAKYFGMNKAAVRSAICNNSKTKKGYHFEWLK